MELWNMNTAEKHMLTGALHLKLRSFFLVNKVKRPRKQSFVPIYGFSLKDCAYLFKPWHPSFFSALFFSFSASLHYSVTLPPSALARNEVSQKLHTKQWKIFSHHFPSCQWLYLSKQTTTETRKGSALAFYHWTSHWNVYFMGERSCQQHWSTVLVQN